MKLRRAHFSFSLQVRLEHLCIGWNCRVLQRKLYQEKHNNYERYRYDEAIRKNCVQKNLYMCNSRQQHKRMGNQVFSHNQLLMVCSQIMFHVLQSFLQVRESIPLGTIQLDLQVANFMFIFNMMFEKLST